ncbi:MAG: GNAT family N-acetyltransferase [Lachnospiraceae bacterium]|nr:GNAT family N-acetyltransferase [Lachnospiraceae bacterium]
MEGIRIIYLAHEDEWTRVIGQFAKHDVYFTPGYVKAFWRNGDGEPFLLYYAGKKLKAANVVMKRPVPVRQTKGAADEALKDCYDFVTPYGYGGFLLQGDTSEEEKQALAHAYRDFCRDHHIVAEFNRYHPVIGNAHDMECLYEVVDLGHTVCMDISSKEKIWEGLTSKNRNLIRKAEKSGVRVYWGREESLFTEFEQIYNATMDKVGADSYYYFHKEFYDSILNDMKHQALVFSAHLAGETIAMSIILYGNGQLHYHLSASKKEYQSYAPTNLLLYEAACFGNSIGMKTFHLGGGLGSREDSLYHFKKQFNRYEDTQFAIGRAVFDAEAYERLREINNNAKETNFFPAYRDIDAE